MIPQGRIIYNFTGKTRQKEFVNLCVKPINGGKFCLCGL